VKILQQLTKINFFRSFSVLASGTMVGQLLMILMSPVITRLYSKEEFGIYATYAALVAVISVIAVLRYELAIPLAKTEFELSRLVLVCLASLMLFSIVLFAAVLLLFDQITEHLHLEPVMAYLLPFGILVSGLIGILNFFSLFHKRYSVLSFSKVSHSLTHVLFQLIAYSLGSIALALGQFLGKCVALVVLIYRNGALIRNLELKIPLNSLTSTAREYRRFPLFSTWAGFFNALGDQFPFVALTVLFNPAAAGLFALTHRVLSLPMAMISSLVGDIFYSNSTAHLNAGTFKASFFETYRALSALITGPCLILALLSPDLFAFVFGEPWRDSGVFAQYMIAFIYANFIAGPLSSVLSLFSKDHEFMVFNIVLLVLRVAALLIGAYMASLNMAIALFCAVGALCNFLLLIRLVYLSGNTAVALIHNSLIPIFINLVLAIPIIWAVYKPLTGFNWWAAVLVSIFIMAAYALIILAKQIHKIQPRQGL